MSCKQLQKATLSKRSFCLQSKILSSARYSTDPLFQNACKVKAVEHYRRNLHDKFFFFVVVFSTLSISHRTNKLRFLQYQMELISRAISRKKAKIKIEKLSRQRRREQSVSLKSAKYWVTFAVTGSSTFIASPITGLVISKSQESIKKNRLKCHKAEKEGKYNFS